MTSGFDPTQVDWNNPDVEYLMKDFERTMVDYRDEIMSLTKSNNQLASEKEQLVSEKEHIASKNKELEGRCSHLEAKYGNSSRCTTGCLTVPATASPLTIPRWILTQDPRRHPSDILKAAGGAATT